MSSPIGGFGRADIQHHHHMNAQVPNSPSHHQQQTFVLPNGTSQWNMQSDGLPQKGTNPWLITTPAGQPPPKIEVHQHQNEGFLEDDEGIAESGL
jgi:hypothetical protein